jgi:UDP-hydrolysing UDP-N-acetyl-D-glucosamine 2-epimerase
LEHAAVSPRRVAVITGTRSEYGLLRSTIAAIQAHPRLEPRLIACGMHLLRRFGGTLREIARDGHAIAARVPMQRGDDGPLDQAAGLARGVRGIAAALERCRADAVLVLGDRIEAMAGALAATTTGRTLAHVHGGDVAPGDFDDALRDAITKLADIHFVATRQAQRRVIAMGENPRCVHLVGAPGLDRLRELLRPSASCLTRRLRSKREPQRFALVVQHAYGRPAHVERRVMDHILGAVRQAGLPRLVIFPNTDRGHEGVLAAIEAHRRTCANGDLRVVRSLPHDDYLSTLARASVLIGNSSSGVIEAPLAGTPSVDVGDRQRGREPGGPGVVHAEETAAAIRAALRRALRGTRRTGAATVYGTGHAGARIADILSRVSIARPG